MNELARTLAVNSSGSVLSTIEPARAGLHFGGVSLSLSTSLCSLLSLSLDPCHSLRLCRKLRLKCFFLFGFFSFYSVDDTSTGWACSAYLRWAAYWAYLRFRALVVHSLCL